ncbi:MAG: acylphosphatase [Eubacteriales bacterium]|nr:acylphosphatase [Eubacteriales bacterium]
MTRWNLILSGRVQGVGLRYRAKYAAQQFQVTGWIRNLNNGDVELELQGEQYNIDSLLEYLHRLPGIRYTILQAEEIELSEESRFWIKST